jgi:hypothetical protein
MSRLTEIANAPDVKSRTAAISMQLLESIARNFFPKFADYFSPFAILEVVCEIIRDISIPDSPRGLRKLRSTAYSLRRNY